MSTKLLCTSPVLFNLLVLVLLLGTLTWVCLDKIYSEQFYQQALSALLRYYLRSKLGTMFGSHVFFTNNGLRSWRVKTWIAAAIMSQSMHLGKTCDLTRLQTPLHLKSTVFHHEEFGLLDLSKEDHYPVCRLDIRQDRGFATGYGYAKHCFQTGTGVKRNSWLAKFLTSRHVHMHKIIFYISNTQIKLMIWAYSFVFRWVDRVGGGVGVRKRNIIEV